MAVKFNHFIFIKGSNQLGANWVLWLEIDFWPSAQTPELCGLDFSWAITLNFVVDSKRPPQDCHLNWEWNMHYEVQIHLDDVPNGKPNTLCRKKRQKISLSAFDH